MAHAPINEGVPAPGNSDAPLRTQLLSNLTTQTHLLSTLFTLLASPPPSSSASSETIQTLYSSLLHSTYDLEGLVDEAYAHQEAYARLMALKEEAKGLEGEVRGALRALEGGVGELEGMVREGRKVRESIERSENGMSISLTRWEWLGDG